MQPLQFGSTRVNKSNLVKTKIMSTEELQQSNVNELANDAVEIDASEEEVQEQDANNLSVSGVHVTHEEQKDDTTGRPGIQHVFANNASLAQLIPLVQQPISSSATRLAHFFCGLVYNEVKHEEFTDSTLYQLIKHAMEMVESHKSLSGPEKKRIVLDVVRMVLVRKTMDEQVRARCLALIDSGAVSEMIDLTIAASKGLVALNARGKAPAACTRCVVC